MTSNQEKNKINFGVTGAHGYLGSMLVNFLRKKVNATVVEMSRYNSNHLDEEKFIRFSLSDSISLKSLERINILIHCAYDFSASDLKQSFDINVSGSRLLFSQAASLGIKIIFISTISSFKDTQSVYGKTKYAIEKEAKKYGALILRPGLIYSDEETSGFFGKILKHVETKRIIPVISTGKRNFYITYANDLCEFIYELALMNYGNKEPLFPINPTAYQFKEILEICAKKRGVSPLFIPVPSYFVYTILRVAEFVKIKLPFKSDSMLSIMSKNDEINTDQNKQFKTQFRSLSF